MTHTLHIPIPQVPRRLVKARKPHDTIAITDPDGRLVVGVALSKTEKRAWLYQEDYEAVVSQYGQAPWFLGHNGKGRWYVRITVPGKPMVARVVGGAISRMAVHYRDWNPLNLRATNFEHVNGAGGVAKSNKRKPTGVHPILGRRSSPFLAEEVLV